MLSMRVWLAVLIVVATVGFAVGASIERHDSHRESAAQLRAEDAATHASESGGEPSTSGEATSSGESGESATTHAKESTAMSTSEVHRELRPLGVNIEAVPFIVLACLLSLALAAVAWLRPRWLLGLLLVAAAMAAFGALDVREAFHQSDEHRTSLAILAAGIAAFHFTAAGAAGAMAARRARDALGETGTITA